MISRFNENNSSNIKFCPLCQAPLQKLKISSTFHIANCSVSLDSLDECPDGTNCSSDSIFHYRDYSHSLLANYRCSSFYVEEKYDEKQKKTPLSRQSPKKSPKRVSKRRKVSKDLKRKSSTSFEETTLLEISDDDDDDINLFKPKKNGKNLVLKRKLYRTNSDISLAEIENGSKKTNTEQKDSDESWEANNLKMSALSEASSNGESEKSFHNSTSIAKSAPLNSPPNKNDCNALERHSNSLEKLGAKSSHRTKSDENGLEDEALLFDHFDFELSPTEKEIEIIDDKKNSTNKIDIELKTLKVSAKSNDTTRLKNAIGIDSDALNDSSSCDELRQNKDCEKNKKTDNKLNFDFFNSVKSKPTDKRSNPKSSSKTHSDIIYSNVKTIYPGYVPNADPNLGSSSSEKAESKPNNRTWRMFGPKPKVPKVCPFYKKIPDTGIVVDAFQYGTIPGVQAYFLTHFHSDHYIGLKKAFSHPIYCSQITANLVKLKLGVHEKYINVINLNERTVVNGVEVVALDANHCPGSVMFLFQLRTGQNFLHVGDFRANTEMESYPELKQLRIHKLFLDTTYCKPAYTFPSQRSVIEDVVKIVKAEFMMNPRTLIVVGSYLIGKEKVFMAIAEEFNCRIWAEPNKMKIFDSIEDDELKRRLTSEPTHAQVHVVSMMQIGIHKLKEYLRPHYRVFSRVVAFRPTGWCHTNSNNSSDSAFKRLEFENVLIYEVPYSEHSSFLELQRFVQFTKPDSIIPTVNVNETSLKEMNKHFKTWLNGANQPSIMDFVNKNNNVR